MITSLTRSRAITLALLSAALLSACGSGSAEGGATTASQTAAAPPPAPPQQPVPQPGTHRASGEVFDFSSGMVGAADINLWVDEANGFGYSYWWARGPLRTDSLGRFEAGQLPDSRITVLAIKDGFVQPCAVRVDVSKDVAVRVEMVQAAALQEQGAARRPQTAVEPWVTGTIYETTANGRQAIAGAALWADDGLGYGMATTRSEPDGRFLLCNLDDVVDIHISKPGYHARWIQVDGRTSRQIDIELLRQ